MTLDDVPAGRICRVVSVCGAALWVSARLAPVASAQAVASPTTTTSSAAPASSAKLTDQERAIRDGDKVFKWILIHSDKPRKPKVEDDKPVPAARVKLARDPVAEPVAGVAPSGKPALAGASEKPATTPSRLARSAGANASAPSANPSATPAATSQTPPVDVASIAPQSRTDASAASSASPASVAAQAIDDVLTPVFRADPQFPQNLLRTLRKGQVQVRFTVLPDGNVATPAVVKTTNPRLNEAALAAVGQWRFVPIRRPQEGIVDLAFDID